MCFLILKNLNLGEKLKQKIYFSFEQVKNKCWASEETKKYKFNFEFIFFLAFVL